MKTSSILALLTIISSLQAAVITYNFDGAITGSMPHPSVGPDIHPGNTPFAGHFTYESTTSQISGTATEAFYALTELHLTFNPATLPETIVLTGGTINVVNDPVNGDRFIINGGQGHPQVAASTGGVNLDFHEIGLFYEDPSGSIFSNTNLPGANLTEADFPFPGSYVFAYSDPGGSSTFQHDGSLDNLSSVSIPEPSSTGLLLGAIGLGLLRRRR